MAKTANNTAEMTELLSIESTTMYERSLIGVLIEKPDLIDQVSSQVEANDFMNHSSRVIYSTLLEMSLTDEPIDLVSLMNALEKKDKLTEAGGITQVAEIKLSAGVPANVLNYAGIVKKRSMARSLAKAGQSIAELGKTSQDIEGSLIEAQEVLMKISQGVGKKDFYAVKDLLVDVTVAIDDRIDQGFSGLKTGFTDLDEKLNGLKGGDLLIVAGRPSMGKTVFGMQIANHVGLAKELSSAVFSLEMTKEKLVERSISQVGGVDYGRMSKGTLNDEDFEGIMYACGMLNEANLYINDTASLTYQQIYAKARSLSRELADTKHPLGLIVIDYLQIMGYQGSTSNRNEQIGEISRALKQMAKDLNVPVVALAQINRGVETRTDKRPLMSDLRESGAVEQDADVIIMMYRDEYYNPDSEYKGMAEAIVRKNRDGSLGTVGLVFEGHHVRFKNADVKWSGNTED